MKKDLFRCRYWTGKFCTRQHESCVLNAGSTVTAGNAAAITFRQNNIRAVLANTAPYQQRNPHRAPLIFC